MMRVPRFAALALACACAALTAGCSRAPRTAQDVLARSVAAHGGARLSSWKTMTITGTIDMEDGITYRAAYRVFAKRPDRLRVEQDMTVARGGRLFYEYFRNGDAVWSRRNLIVGRSDPHRLAVWMSQCFGVAYYVEHATRLELKPEATSDWLTKSAKGYEVAERRPAYVVAATTPLGVVDLYVDKKTFYLLQETTPDAKRLFSAFRDFAGAVHPTLILETTKSRTGETTTPIAYQDVRYDVAIDDAMFEEDMPKTAARR